MTEITTEPGWHITATQWNLSTPDPSGMSGGSGHYLIRKTFQGGHEVAELLKALQTLAFASGARISIEMQCVPHQ